MYNMDTLKKDDVLNDSNFEWNSDKWTFDFETDWNDWTFETDLDNWNTEIDWND